MNWWLKEHFKDPFVKKAKQEGLRARAAYKLSEIDNKYRLVRPKQIVVDLGAAPGSWSQYLSERYPSLRIIAIDLLPIQEIPGVTFLQGDFNDEKVREQMIKILPEKKLANLILSDMAPNLSGIKDYDQSRSIQLVNHALNFAKQILCFGGHFLIKLFQGTETLIFEKEVRTLFKEVFLIKPNASRRRSSEFFLLARHFKLNH